MKKEQNHEEMFETYYEQFLPMVFHIMKKLNIRKNKEDYMQIGRIAIYEAWYKYDKKKGELAPYVYSYIFGKLKNHLTNEAKWYDGHQLCETDVIGNISLKKYEIDFPFIFLDFIHRLPLSEKEKLWLIEGIVYNNKPSEIADKYGCSVHTVKTWRRNALQKLRNIYKEKNITTIGK